MSNPTLHTLDLNFQGKSGTIASYLIKYGDGAILIESGPGSTLGALEAGLAAHRLTFRDVTHVFLTHIHLDHAGAAGYLASQGAIIHVHPVGAPHLLNPEKLIASASRIYGDKMGTLWGEFLAVPPDKLVTPQNGEEIVAGNVRIVALDTPGHAEHHFCYQFEDVLFSGDVGGVRIPGYPYLRVPLPPPELHFEKWHNSVAIMRKAAPKRIAPTHYGLFDDVDWHLDFVEKSLESALRWLEETMPAGPTIEEVREKFETWMDEEGARMGISPETARAYQLSNPSYMAAEGLARYWRKYRAPQGGL